VHLTPDTPFPGSVARLRVPLRDALPLRLLRTLGLWRRRAAQRRQLLSIDDHLLRDIGVTRAQVEHEAAKPAWRA
jgi:uncharacterized protein YjiS (DUF1127 family)